MIKNRHVPMKNGRFLRLHASHPDAAEQRRDLLRRLGRKRRRRTEMAAEMSNLAVINHLVGIYGLKFAWYVGGFMSCVKHSQPW